jgi:hypothetical protein
MNQLLYVYKTILIWFHDSLCTLELLLEEIIFVIYHDILKFFL